MTKSELKTQLRNLGPTGAAALSLINAQEEDINALREALLCAAGAADLMLDEWAQLLKSTEVKP